MKYTNSQALREVMTQITDVKWIDFDFKQQRALSLSSPPQHVFQLLDAMTCCAEKIPSLQSL